MEYPRFRLCQYDEIKPQIHWAMRHKPQYLHTFDRRLIDFQLLYVVTGSFLISYQDSGSSCTVTPGKLLVIRPGPRFAMTITDPDTVLLGAHFDFFHELTVQKESDMVLNTDEKLAETVFCCEPVLPDGYPLLPNRSLLTPSQEVIACLNAAIQEFNQDHPCRPLACQSIMLYLLTVLARDSELSRRHDTRYGEHIKDLMRQIRDNCAADWSNDNLGAKLNISKEYLNKLFGEIAGSSPHRFVQQTRHAQAKHLIRETDWKLETVARAVGYEDLHYFSRQFKRLEGIAPSEYRKLAKLI